MTHLVAGFGFACITALIVIVGDAIIKIAADGNQPVWSALVIAGCALYAISALFWFYAMHHVSLVQAGVAYSMLSLIALAAVAVIYFGETLHVREYAGLGCALLAMLLLSRVT